MSEPTPNPEESKIPGLESLKSTAQSLIPGGKLLPALHEAYNKFKEAKDKNIFSRAWIFVKSFLDEYRGVQKEEQKVSADTEAKVKQGVKETMEEANKAVALDESVTGGDRNIYEEVLGTAVKHLKELDQGPQANAYEALAKLGNATSGSIESLTSEQASALAAAGLLTIKELKERFSNKDSFRSMMETLSKASDKSKFPLKKLFETSTLGIFKLDEANAQKILKSIGIDADMNLGNIGGMMQGLDAKMTLSKLKEEPLTSESEQQITVFFKKYLFKNTSDENIGKTVRLINKMIVEKTKEITVENFTEIVFWIDTKDFDHLAMLLGGPKLGKEIVSSANG